MRTFVLILMIALLPMRMWAAEGMAVRMAQEQLPAAGMSTADGMPDDCPMMAEAEAGQASQGEQEPAAHCMSCHLCAAAACLPDVAFEPGPVPAVPPDSASDRYLSAWLAPDRRPPIS